jgi:hypothetical protein
MVVYDLLRLVIHLVSAVSTFESIAPNTVLLKACSSIHIYCSGILSGRCVLSLPLACLIALLVSVALHFSDFRTQHALQMTMY